MTDAKTRPTRLRFLDQQFDLPTSSGRVVTAILIVLIEGVFFLQLPKLVAMFRALGVELPSLPGRFIQVHPLLCQGIALSIALIAVWAWVKKRGRILGVLFCCALLQMGAVAWASIHHPFSTFSSSIHR